MAMATAVCAACVPSIGFVNAPLPCGHKRVTVTGRRGSRAMLRALFLQVLHWSLLLAPAVGQLAAASGLALAGCHAGARRCFTHSCLRLRRGV